MSSTASHPSSPMTHSANALLEAAHGSAAQPPRERQAASLIVLRDSPQGPEVLLARRAERPGDQNSGAAVFPGGLLDASDRGHYSRCAGLDDAAASARLGLAEHGLHYWVAALRECFEEAGLLLATDANGALLDLAAHDADELTALRRALHANEIGMAEVCARFGVQLAADRLAYFSHWITPKGMPKIFDTRFFKKFLGKIRIVRGWRNAGRASDMPRMAHAQLERHGCNVFGLQCIGNGLAINATNNGFAHALIFEG